MDFNSTEEDDPDSVIDEAYEEVDESVKRTVEDEIHLSDIKEGMNEPDNERVEIDDNSDVEYSRKVCETDYDEFLDDDTYSNAIAEQKKEGYMIKDKIEHDLDQIKKSLEPTISEDEEAKYKTSKGVPRYFGWD